MSPFRASVPLTSGWKHFGFSVADGVATVWFRPARQAQRADLRGVRRPARPARRIAAPRRLPGCSCCAGAGRAFCSGGDVNEIIGATLAMPPDELLAFTRMSGEVIREMPGLPHPGDRGRARHGGRGRCGDRARRRLSASALRRPGSLSCSPRSGCPAGTWARPTCCRRLVGLGHATRLLMLGDTVSAEEAARIGLVSSLVEVDGSIRR